MGNCIKQLFRLVKSFFKKRPKVITYTYRTCKKTHAYEFKQEEIDAILDKIFENGYDNLTQKEKQKLLDASHSI